MINLRKLEIADAPYMLEWMHDPEMQKCFQKDMMNMSLQQAEDFCRNSGFQDIVNEGQDIHYAIVDERNEYLGTISLKNISLTNLSAEYAISTRKCAQGKGIARTATEIILQKGFDELKLHRIYLNVLSNNKRAIRFYEKCGFVYEGEFREHLHHQGNVLSLKWYSMLDNEFIKRLKKGQ
jgi:Acetyltransferases, including N-acetylases of ribosomal proteins